MPAQIRLMSSGETSQRVETEGKAPLPRVEESTPEEVLMVIHRLVHLLPREYQVGKTGQGEGRELGTVGKC